MITFVVKSIWFNTIYMYKQYIDCKVHWFLKWDFSFMYIKYFLQGDVYLILFNDN